MRTLKELAQESIDIQNACNLSGILHSAAEAIIELHALMPAASTSEINTHPIMRAWVSKICDMTGNYTGAYPADELRLIMEAPDSDEDVRRSTAAALALAHTHGKMAPRRRWRALDA